MPYKYNPFTGALDYYQSAASGSFSVSTTTVPFTDGDTARRVTITDANVLVTSKIVVSVTRPSSASDTVDKGYLYMANVVNVAAGSFDVIIICMDWGSEDPILDPPNETITLNYTIG